MKNLIIYIIILLTLPKNIPIDNPIDTFLISKSEYFKIEEAEGNYIVKEEDLEVILKQIYQEFRDKDIEIFPEGLQFDILSNAEGNRLGYSNHSTISYYARSDNKWNDKSLYRTTMHEMGHMFKNRYFTKEDFKRYLVLRDINLETYLQKEKEMTIKYPHLTESNITYLLETEEMLAEDFRMIFSNEKYAINTQFLWGDLTEKQKEEIENFFIEVLKRERTEKQAIELIVYNATNHYGMFGE